MGIRSGSHYSEFQPLAQIGELPGSNQPLSCTQHELISSMEPKTREVNDYPLLLSLGTHCETSGAPSSPLPLTPVHAAEISLRVCQPLLESSLQSSYRLFLTRAQLFHTAPLFYQSRDYPSQGLTWPNSFLLQVSPSTPISLVPVSTEPVDVYHLCVSHFVSTSPSDFQHSGPS